MNVYVLMSVYVCMCLSIYIDTYRSLDLYVPMYICICQLEATYSCFVLPVK